MKFKFLLLSFLVLSFYVQGQDVITMNSQDGVEVSYQLTKISAGSKKDSYLVVIKAENKNDFDLFYSVPLSKQADGSSTLSALANKSFAQSTVRNSTGLFGDNVNLNGSETKMMTNDDRLLFTITKGGFITGEKEFKVKTGIKPIITNTFLMPMKSIDNFDLAVNEGIVNGDWIANCGNIQMSLVMMKNEKNELVIQQSVYGKKNIWKKTTANTFQKAEDKTSILSYNKKDNNFTYSNEDGVICSWNRK